MRFAGETGSGVVRAGALLTAAGRGAEIGLGLVTQLAVARSLGTAGYGAISQGIALLHVLGALCVFGLSETVARALPIYRGMNARLRGTVWFGLAVSAGLGAMVAGVLLVSLGWGLGAGEGFLSGLLPLFALALPFFATTQFVHGILRGSGRASLKLVSQDLGVGTLRALLIVGLAALHVGLVGIAWGYVAIVAVAAVVGVWTVHRYVVPLLGRAGDRAIEVPAAQLVSFMVPLLVIDLVWIGLEHLDVLILGWLRAPDEVGLYRAGTQVARMLGIVVSAVAYLYVPTISRHFAEGQAERIRALYATTVTWISLLVLPLAAVLTVGAHVIVELLYGAAFAASADVIRISVVGYLAHALTGLNGSTLTVIGRVAFTMWTAVLAFAVNVALDLALIPTWGMRGAALAGVLALALLNLTRQVGLHHFLGLPGRGSTYALQAAGVTLVVGLGWLMARF